MEERGTLTSRMESIPTSENSFPLGLYYVFWNHCFEDFNCKTSTSKQLVSIKETFAKQPVACTGPIKLAIWTTKSLWCHRILRTYKLDVMTPLNIIESQILKSTWNIQIMWTLAYFVENDCEKCKCLAAT